MGRTKGAKNKVKEGQTILPMSNIVSEPQSASKKIKKDKPVKLDKPAKPTAEEK